MIQKYPIFKYVLHKYAAIAYTFNLKIYFCSDFEKLDKTFWANFAQYIWANFAQLLGKFCPTFGQILPKLEL